MWLQFFWQAGSVMPQSATWVLGGVLLVALILAGAYLLSFTLRRILGNEEVTDA